MEQFTPLPPGATVVSAPARPIVPPPPPPIISSVPTFRTVPLPTPGLKPPPPKPPINFSLPPTLAVLNQKVDMQVAGLDGDMSNEKVEELLTLCGVVSAFRRMPDTKTGKLKSYGLAEMHDIEGALRCGRLLSSLDVLGHPLVVRVEQKVSDRMREYVRVREGIRAEAAQKMKDALAKLEVERQAATAGLRAVETDAERAARESVEQRREEMRRELESVPKQDPFDVMRGAALLEPEEKQDAAVWLDVNVLLRRWEAERGEREMKRREGEKARLREFERDRERGSERRTARWERGSGRSARVWDGGAKEQAAQKEKDAEYEKDRERHREAAREAERRAEQDRKGHERERQLNRERVRSADRDRARSGGRQDGRRRARSGDRSGRWQRRDDRRRVGSGEGGWQERRRSRDGGGSRGRGRSRSRSWPTDRRGGRADSRSIRRRRHSSGSWSSHRPATRRSRRSPSDRRSGRHRSSSGRRRRPSSGRRRRPSSGRRSPSGSAAESVDGCELPPSGDQPGGAAADRAHLKQLLAAIPRGAEAVYTYAFDWDTVPSGMAAVLGRYAAQLSLRLLPTHDASRLQKVVSRHVKHRRSATDLERQLAEMYGTEARGMVVRLWRFFLFELLRAKGT